MEDITKKQLFLLLLLVSIVTGVSSAIIVYTLLEQAPPPITQIIQRVINRASDSAKAILPPQDVVTLEKAAVARDALIQDIALRVSPAVVSVIASKDIPVVEQDMGDPFANDPFFKQVFPDLNLKVPQSQPKGTQKQQVSAGSGFIVSKDGLVVTNRHVVEDVDAEYSVILNDGKKLPAKVLARDPVQDLAVLKIEGTNFSLIPLGDSDAVKIGQSAIAIGNALGQFTNTLSVGVISGLRRTLVASGAQSGPEELSDVFQTDAAINPGNSGGPLLNLQGEVIGLNTAVAEGAQSIGFAIPINRIKRSVESVKSTGKIIYPFIGVRYTIITPELKTKNNLPIDYGALVGKGAQGESAVTEGSPAQKAGIKEGDIILEFGGVKINQDNPLAKLIQARHVGDTVTLKILRDGKEMTIIVTLEERK